MVKKKTKKVNLNSIRNQIDAVDQSILRSLSKRADLVIAAGENKKEAGDKSFYKPEREVADKHENVRVAGSLPPLEESYRPDLVLDETKALPIYKTLIEGLLPYVDIFLCETISSIQEMINSIYI